MEILLGMKIPEALRPFMSAYFRGDAAAMAALFAPDAELWRIQQPEPISGRAAIHAWLEGFISQFQHASLHRMKWFVSHNAVLSISELTMELELLGEGKHLVAMAASYELDEAGQIRRLRTFVDIDGAIRMTPS